ncbi:MAG: cytochrome c [Sediminibacterium sp.]|nr:MAG: cytochrome c [Sediminibacterium sp.]
MKKTFSILMVLTMLYACGGEQTVATDAASASTNDPNSNPTYDPQRGEGKFTKVEVGTKIDEKLVKSGTKVFAVKCSACHKLTSEKLVGPGWKGVTERFKPEWIMNFVTNTDAMLNKDPKAQAQLEICLVRMPNQNVTDDDARNIYEFMRKNDSKK